MLPSGFIQIRNSLTVVEQNADLARLDHFVFMTEPRIISQ